MNRKTIFSLILSSFVIFLSACQDDNILIKEAGVIKTQTRNYSQFKSIEIESGLTLNVFLSDEHSLKVRADNNFLPYILTTISNETLNIKRKKGYAFDGNNNVVVFVTTKSLEKIKISGGSIVLVDTIRNNSFNLDISGGSSFISSIFNDKVNINSSGGSTVLMYGRTNSLNENISGGGILKAMSLESKIVNAEISGGSKVTNFVTETLNANLSGGSSLSYKGSPLNINKNLSGGSEVIALD